MWVVSVVGGATRRDTIVPGAGQWTVRLDGTVPPGGLTDLTLGDAHSAYVEVAVLEHGDTAAYRRLTAVPAANGDGIASGKDDPAGRRIAPMVRAGAHHVGSVRLVLRRTGGMTYWQRLECTVSCLILGAPTDAPLTQPAAGVVELTGAGGVYHLQLRAARAGGGAPPAVPLNADPAAVSPQGQGGLPRFNLLPLQREVSMTLLRRCKSCHAAYLLLALVATGVPDVAAAQVPDVRGIVIGLAAEAVSSSAPPLAPVNRPGAGAMLGYGINRHALAMIGVGHTESLGYATLAARLYTPAISRGVLFAEIGFASHGRELARDSLAVGIGLEVGTGLELFWRPNRSVVASVSRWSGRFDEIAYETMGSLDTPARHTRVSLGVHFRPPRQAAAGQ